MEFSAPTRSQPSGSSLSDSNRKTFHRPQQSPSGKSGSDVLILKVEDVLTIILQCINVNILLRRYFNYLGIVATVIYGTLLNRSKV